METIRVGLVQPQEMNTDACLNLVGVEEMLAQEGIPWQPVRTLQETAARSAGVNVLIAVDHGCFSVQEGREIAQLARVFPLCWSGIPRADAPLELLQALGLPRVEIDDLRCLRLIQLQPHDITSPFSHPKETTLRAKFIEHLRVACPRSGQEIAEMARGDRSHIGAAIYALDAAPRRIVFTFPLGKVYCVKTSLYTDLDHQDQTDYPICTIVDVLRGILREALRWVVDNGVLVRKYFWPFVGAVPKGFYYTASDLCGYSERGVRWLREVCDREGARITFYDYHPFRLKRGEAGPYEVCLHSDDEASYQSLASQKRELEQRQGIRVRGCKRHGLVAKDNFPRIWRDLIRAGFAWASTHNSFSHPFHGSGFPVATGNRLPGYLVDIGTGERMTLLELPCMDSEDGERLANHENYPKLDWNEFVSAFRTRLHYAHRHNLVAGYEVHGWVAGVIEETGRAYGALDAQRLLPMAIREAKGLGFICTLGGDDLYRWWMHRQVTEIELGERTIHVRQPSTEWTLVLEVVPPAGKKVELHVEIQQQLAPERWLEQGKTRILCPTTGSTMLWF